MPTDWLNLTTHRLDIYNEKLAKTQFLAQFEKLYKTENVSTSALSELPTAYDYIRLGHPLSSVLEWVIANLNDLNSEHVISFSSQTMPVLAILRTNLLQKKETRILYTDSFPQALDTDLLKSVYNYNFKVEKIDDLKTVEAFKGCTILVSEHKTVTENTIHQNIDFYVNQLEGLGSMLLISKNSNGYISDIQHVRRRETIAMTPANCLTALKLFTEQSSVKPKNTNKEVNKPKVQSTINSVTGTTGKALVASSGLSMQYAIMMGLVHHAQQEHPKGKAIKFVVPPNCYGGTNDQARRVAACSDNVEVVDLPVDGDNDMVNSVATVLTQIANEDALPYIIAEIPTNPRVEVPDLLKLKATLTKDRQNR